MKRKDVCKILKVSPTTVDRWRNEGKLSTNIDHNGHFYYLEDEVYNILNKNKPRLNIIYARVSTHKQKNDLSNQSELIQQFCMKNGIVINKIFTDIGSGLDFSKRKEFTKLLDLVEDNKVKSIIISHKDRLARVGFDMFKSLFAKHGCEIIVMSEVNNEKTDELEIFEEMISLLHCFDMKMYSTRRKSILKILKETGADVSITTVKQRATYND